MNLFKIIIALFLIYFIRRFIQMYRALRLIQIEKEIKDREDARNQQNQEKEKTVDAEYKVID